MQERRKVLAVDDNPVNLAILNEILEDAYDVEYAEQGREAIRIAGECSPDIILLDVMMPVMDGLEVCRHLRTNSDLNNTVIIMVSAKAMPSERAAGFEAGADDYITKPFDEVGLLKTLQRYNEGRQNSEDDLTMESWNEMELQVDQGNFE